MEAEQLNIKLRLDLSGVDASVKKVKQQFNGMAKTVKDSLPHIKKEGDKAEKSLGNVDKATDKLKKSLNDVGTKAQSSLGRVYSESEKVANKLKNIKFDTKFGFDFDSDSISDGASAASDSFSELQSAMQSIRNIDIASFIVSNFDKIKTGVKKSVDGVKKILKQAKETFRDFYDDIDVFYGWAPQSFKNLSENIGKIKNQLASATRAAIAFATSLTGILTAGVALGAIAGIGASIANNTKQYREEQSKLNSAFQAAGANAEVAAQAYNGLFRFLGQSDRAVEAANHLAKITTNTQNLAEWTTIAQGIYATFGDSLPIEGLTEAANESLRVGKVTGVLEDALNWAGVSEDEFNAQLEKTTSLEEREVLLRQTLNSLYQDAAQIYEQNNKRIIEQNEAQARLDATMARIGQQTQVLVTSWINLKNVVMTVLAPAIIYISAVFSVLIDKLAAAIKWLGALIGIDFKADQIGGIVSGVGGIGSGISDATNATDGLTDSLDKATAAAQKLKRTTMGFDELNIVSNPNTSSGGSSGGAGAGTGGIGAGGITGIETGTGIFGKMGEQIEDVKAKVEDFFEKWKTQIAIIGGALAALGIAGLLQGLGKAIGLGDKFLSTMAAIKKLAAAAITIVLQYTLVNEFMDKYIDGEGFKEYLKGLLVSALGTWVLYSMFGPAGLVIGLGVTAVASIKSVIDNGGITNTESAVVALTGLATAIGAVYKAVDLLQKSDAISKIATAFGSIGTKISGIVGPIGTFIGSLSTGAILTIAGIIAAIASAAYFLYENWDKVTNAAKKFFDQNIAPKLENIKDSFKKIGEALSNLIPEGLKQLLKDIWKGIKDIASSIKEWFESTDLLKGIGKIFETIGGVIFSVVTGVIAGAFSALAGFIDGFVQTISGVVEIISGIINAIVALFQGDLPKAWDAVKQIAQGIFDEFQGLYKMTIGVVVDFVQGIIDWFVKLWDELVGHSIVPDMINAIIEWFKKLPSKCLDAVKSLFTNIVDKFKEMFSNLRTTVMNGWNNIKAYWNENIAPKFTKQYWLNKFDTIRAGIADKIGAARTAVQNGWNNIKSYWNENIAPKFTKKYWQDKFDTIRAGASEKVNATKTAFQNGWNNVKSWFSSNVAPKFTINFWKNKFNTIKDGARSALNGVIDVVERAVNGIIKKINTLSWKIPDWVPKYGGDRFGFNFNTIKIPRLAYGGIAMNSSLVNVGEAGKEAILPLDRNTEWMDTLANKIAARQQPQRVVLQVGEKELGWATIGAINGITKQTGQLQLLYV